MAVKRFATEYPGVRFKQHPTRKNGVRFDRYFSIYYRLKGKLFEEGLGWASAGWTAQKAAGELAKLKESQRLGQAGQTLKEKRGAEQERRENEEKRKEQERKDALTFGEIFNGAYIEEADRTKDKVSCRRERELYRGYIQSLIGELPLKEITVNHVETIKSRMLDAKKAPATIRYCLAVVRQVFNFAIDHGMYVGSNPVSKVKKPSGDNKRVRFLTHDEAEALLDTIREKSADVYNISLLSLHTGMRAGEIFALTWTDVDLKARLLTLRDTKNGRTRFARMTDEVVEMLFALPKGKPDELVFPARAQKEKEEAEQTRTKISRTFERAVDELKLNEGVTDPRQMVVFHTLRHTYASWMLRSGADLYTVSKLLGHRTIAMTERYGHVADETLQDAVRAFQKDIAGKAEEKGRNAE